MYDYNNCAIIYLSFLIIQNGEIIVAENERVKRKGTKDKNAVNKNGIKYQIQSKIGISIIVVMALVALLVVLVVYNLLIKANNTELQQD